MDSLQQSDLEECKKNIEKKMTEKISENRKLTDFNDDNTMKKVDQLSKLKSKVKEYEDLLSTTIPVVFDNETLYLKTSDLLHMIKSFKFYHIMENRLAFVASNINQIQKQLEQLSHPQQCYSHSGYITCKCGREQLLSMMSVLHKTINNEISTNAYPIYLLPGSFINMVTKLIQLLEDDDTPEYKIKKLIKSIQVEILKYDPDKVENQFVIIENKESDNGC